MKLFVKQRFIRIKVFQVSIEPVNNLNVATIYFRRRNTTFCIEKEV